MIGCGSCPFMPPQDFSPHLCDSIDFDKQHKKHHKIFSELSNGSNKPVKPVSATACRTSRSPDLSAVNPFSAGRSPTTDSLQWTRPLTHPAPKANPGRRRLNPTPRPRLPTHSGGRHAGPVGPRSSPATSSCGTSTDRTPGNRGSKENQRHHLKPPPGTPQQRRRRRRYRPPQPHQPPAERRGRRHRSTPSAC